MIKVEKLAHIPASYVIDSFLNIYVFSIYI